MKTRTPAFTILLLIAFAAAACGPAPRATHPAGSRAAAPTAVIAFGRRLEPITPANASRLELLASIEQSEVCAVAFDPAGDRLAASTDDGIAIRQTGDGQVLATLPASGSWIRSLAFSADGARLAATTLGAVRVWDVASGELLTFLEDFDDVGGVALSPDGSRVAAGSGCAMGMRDVPDLVQVWDAATGELRFDYTLSKFVVDVAFSPDGTLLAAAAGERVVVLDAATGALRMEKIVSGEYALSLAFSPDGALLAAAGRAVHMWDPVSGEQHGGFSRSWDANVVDLAFTADGRLLVTGSAHLLFWDVSNVMPRLVQEIELGGVGNYVNSLALNADSTLLATCEHSERLRLWGVPAADD